MLGHVSKHNGKCIFVFIPIHNKDFNSMGTILYENLTIILRELITTN